MKMHFRDLKIVFLGAYFSAILFSFSQNKVEFKKLQGGEVIPQSISYAIKQDSIGNVWIASEEGVLKHNSKNFRLYNTYNGLPESVSNKTTQIFIDSNNRLWIGLERGVCLYNKDFDKFDLIGSKTEINPSSVSAITQDQNKTIWIGAYNGIWRLNNDYTLTQYAGAHVVQAVLCVKDSIFFGTPNGLFYFNKNEDKLTKVVFSNQEQVNVSSLAYINNNIVIGSKSGKLYKTSAKALFPKLIDLKELISKPITDIIQDNKSNYYIATNGDGLFYLNNKFELINHYVEDVNDLNSLTSNGIYDIELGKENIVWITTYGGGVNYFNTKGFPFMKLQHQINNKNSISANFTRAIAKDKNDNLWFGNKRGISIWNLKNNKWKHINNFLDSKITESVIVLAIEADNNYMWIGTYGYGLFRVNINTFKVESFNKLFPDKNILKKIYAVYKDGSGNIWLGGIESNIKVIRKDNTIDTYPINDVRYITQSKDGNILIACRKGVYRVKDAKHQFELIQDIIPNSKFAYSKVNAVVETNNKNLVLATNGAGAVFYNTFDNTKKILNLKKGMPSDIIQGIILQNDSSFWMSSTRGLVKILAKKKDTIIMVYDKKDGLASTEYNYGSFKKIKDSLFAFGGVDGVTLFNPYNIQKDNFTPNIEFISFKLFNKLIPPGKKPLKTHINQIKNIDLNYRENSFEINFIGVLQNAPSKVKYSWMLEGFEGEWSNPTYTNFANYTNLNAGEYIFKVKASNRFGKFGKEKRVIIHIKSPWWATGLAYLLYLVAVLLIIFLIIHFTSVAVNKRNADEQINFFNSITHEIKTPLAVLISSLDGMTNTLDSNDQTKKRVQTTVKRINALFEQMLNFHRVTSNNDLDQNIVKISLTSHIEKIVYNFKPLITERELTVNINNNWKDEFFYFDKEIFDKILHNLLSNAIKYSYKKGVININLTKTLQKELKLEVIDQGLGIPKDQQKYILNRYFRARNVINSQRPGTGLGLVMVKKLLEKTGGNIKFISEETKGTKFTVTLKNLIKKYKEKATEEKEDMHQLIESLEDQTELDAFSDCKILIVEDNDELRESMVNTLSIYFQVFESKNGKEGLQVTSQVHPDIILTDLIMPEMDGMEMSKAIKNDINLNHIPIFMLTVLHNSAQKLKSVEMGISTYIEKPINMKYLLAKMVSTLKYHRKLREKYIHESDSDNATIFRNKNDQEFLKQLEDTIIANLEDNSFSVHNLSESFGMSRTSLYMKLKNLVDLSPQDFIIHTKLRLAKRLLIEGKLSIKEVAYNSGFSNPKYFSTVFKKFYKMTPSQFLDSLKNE